jgi:hypothetical protein
MNTCREVLLDFDARAGNWRSAKSQQADDDFSVPAMIRDMSSPDVLGCA